MNLKRCVALITTIALFVMGCASPNVNPSRAKTDTGYVDIYSEEGDALAWEVKRFDDKAQDFKRVFMDVEPPPGGVVRLAFPPGQQRLRMTVVNRVIVSPTELELEVQDGKVTPLRVALTEDGVTIVNSRDINRGGTARGRYGRRTRVQGDEAIRFRINATAEQAVEYQPKERMSYAR